MNRISRIAALALSLAAAGTAFAESPTPEPATTPASTAPLAVVTGVTHDFDFGAAPVVSLRSRAEVRQEVLAAVAAGTLRSFGEIDPGSLPASAQPVRLMARAGR